MLTLRFEIVGSSSAADMKQQAADIRLSVPVGTITASTVDDMASNSKNLKKQRMFIIFVLIDYFVRMLYKLNVKQWPHS